MTISGELIGTAPLGCDDLRSVIDEGATEVNLQVSLRQVEIDGKFAHEHAQVTMRLAPGGSPAHSSGPAKPARPTRVYALVDGGWVPPPFVLPRNLFVDQNVVVDFQHIRQGHTTISGELLRWWMEFLDEPETVLNPLPYALEGTQRCIQTVAEFRRAYEDGVAHIQAVLPHVTVVPFDERSHSWAYSQVVSKSTHRVRAEAFLQAAVPYIVHPRRATDRVDALQKLFALAAAHSVPRRSLVMFAALSCLYDDPKAKGQAIGRLVLRPKVTYTAADAYAASADLQHLELLVLAHATSGCAPAALCTRDSGLALLWSALSPRLRSGTSRIRLDITPELLRGIPAEELQVLMDSLRVADSD